MKKASSSNSVAVSDDGLAADADFVTRPAQRDVGERELVGRGGRSLRRSTAFTRAASSRGLKGLAT